MDEFLSEEFWYAENDSSPLIATQELATTSRGAHGSSLGRAARRGRSGFSYRPFEPGKQAVKDAMEINLHPKNAAAPTIARRFPAMSSDRPRPWGDRLRRIVSSLIGYPQTIWDDAGGYSNNISGSGIDGIIIHGSKIGLVRYGDQRINYLDFFRRESELGRIESGTNKPFAIISCYFAHVEPGGIPRGQEVAELLDRPVIVFGSGDIVSTWSFQRSLWGRGGTFYDENGEIARETLYLPPMEPFRERLANFREFDL
ncbi:hypothetical protein FHW00_002144 [Ochrobactrum sp. P6BSIII]|uniref:hypothetical protein n=1 Tax=unclassified Ochrobactrum TaxID=239106 RepID=UPI001116B34A|nr:hypothetical protein [Ochrobactrum sp. P6BSIII]